jgi:hypothetical protein
MNFESQYYKICSVFKWIKETNTTRKQAYLCGKVIESWQSKEAGF